MRQRVAGERARGSCPGTRLDTSAELAEVVRGQAARARAQLYITIVCDPSPLEQSHDTRKIWLANIIIQVCDFT